MEDGTTREIERAKRNAKRLAEMKREHAALVAASERMTKPDAKVAPGWVRG